MVTAMISLSQHRDLMALRDRFRDHLLDVSKERHLREDVVRTATGLTEIEWVLHERAQMLAAVNEVRTARGAPPVGLDDVERADRVAAGHCDWLDKFSFYCAEIAQGR